MTNSISTSFSETEEWTVMPKCAVTFLDNGQYAKKCVTGVLKRFCDKVGIFFRKRLCSMLKYHLGGSIMFKGCTNSNLGSIWEPNCNAYLLDDLSFWRIISHPTDFHDVKGCVSDDACVCYIKGRHLAVTLLIRAVWQLHRCSGATP